MARRCLRNVGFLLGSRLFPVAGFTSQLPLQFRHAGREQIMLSAQGGYFAPVGVVARNHGLAPSQQLVKKLANSRVAE